MRAQPPHTADLRPELEIAMLEALAARKRLPADAPLSDTYHLLHRALVGPPGSGKTWMAQRYVEKLADAGLLVDPTAYLITGASSDNFVQWVQILKEGKNRAIIIDEPEKLAIISQQQLGKSLGDLIRQSQAIVLLTGYAEGVAALRETDEAFKGMGNTIDVLQAPSAEDTAKLKRLRMVAAWQANSATVLDLGGDLDPPAKASFMRKPAKQGQTT